LQKLLEDFREVSSCGQHNTIVSTAINIFPMYSSFKEKLYDLKVSFKAGPMQGVGSHLFGGTH
jgi:hypothetical protein